MELKEIAPEIFSLKVSVNLSEKDVNVYIFRGEVPTLLDIGTNTQEVYQTIQKALQELGIKRLEQVLLTHWHVDHAGGAVNLRKDGARILIGKRDYEEWVDFYSGKSFKVFEKYAQNIWGVPPEQLALILKINQGLTRVSSLPEEVDKLDVGAVIPAGNTTVKAIFTPGHTAGHLSYYQEEMGMLFTGDFLLPDVVPYPGVWPENGGVVSGFPSYLQALDRVETLGAKAYFPAHGTARKTPAARCIEIRNQILRQVERYTFQGSIYEGGLELGKGKFNPVSTFIHMHYVFGWEALKGSTASAQVSSLR